MRRSERRLSARELKYDADVLFRANGLAVEKGRYESPLACRFERRRYQQTGTAQLSQVLHFTVRSDLQVNRNCALDATFLCSSWIERFDAIKQIAIAAALRIGRRRRIDFRRARHQTGTGNRSNRQSGRGCNTDILGRNRWS